MAGLALGRGAARRGGTSGVFKYVFGPTGLGGVARDARDSFVSPFVRLAQHPSSPRAAVEAAAALPLGPRLSVRSGEWGMLSRPEIRARPWFRGDASGHAAHQVDPARFDEGSLFGPGLYLTDSPRVAESYTVKGGDAFTSSEPVLMSDFIRGRFGSVAARPNDWTAAMRHAARKDMIAWLKERRAQARANGEGFRLDRYRIGGEKTDAPWHTLTTTKPGYGPNMKGFAVSPSWVLADRRPLTRSEQVRFDQMLRRWKGPNREKTGLMNAVGYGRQRSVGTMFDKLERELGYAGAAGFLKKAGVDALQYHGGAITGSDMGPHNALVVYNMLKARPNAGVTTPPRLGERSRRAVEGYRDRLDWAKGQAEEAGYRQADQVVDLGQGWDYYNGLARVAAKDAGITNPVLRQAYIDTFLRGVELRRMKQPQQTPFGPSR